MFETAKTGFFYAIVLPLLIIGYIIIMTGFKIKNWTIK